MADHWRSPNTDEDSEIHVFGKALIEEYQPGSARWMEMPREGTISRDIMFAIIFGCVGILIGFGMGMVVS